MCTLQISRIHVWTKNDPEMTFGCNRSYLDIWLRVHSMLVEASTSKKPPITEIYIFMIHVPRGLKKGKNENPPVSLIGNFGNFFWNFKLRFCIFDDFSVSVKGKIWRKFLRKNWPIHRNFLKLFFPDPAEICSVDRP